MVKKMVVEAADTLKLTDIQIFALTLLGEARGLNYPIGMQEVACVVRNRLTANRWWGHTERAICLYPFQFSCWNLNDPNRAKLLKWRVEEPLYEKAAQIAIDAMAGPGDDLTHGATHYFNHVTLPQAKWPKWFKGQTPCHTDGPIWYFDLHKEG